MNAPGVCYHTVRQVLDSYIMCMLQCAAQADIDPARMREALAVLCQYVHVLQALREL